MKHSVDTERDQAWSIGEMGGGVGHTKQMGYEKDMRNLLSCN